MASIPIGREAQPVTLPSVIPPAPAVMAILDRFNRDELGNAIEVLVALLDIWDGDADIELAGDETDFTGAEDEACHHSLPGHLIGPGCPIADPDCAVDDSGCDDINDDREHEEHGVARYSIDQTRGPLWSGMVIE